MLDNKSIKIFSAIHPFPGRKQCAAAKQELDGILVRQMIKDDRGFFAGLILDFRFGPRMMFGLGGIHIKVLKDISFRLA